MSARTLTPERIDAWMTWKREERAASVELHRIHRAHTTGRAAVLVPLDLAAVAFVPADRLERSRRRGYARTRVATELACAAAVLRVASIKMRRPR